MPWHGVCAFLTRATFIQMVFLVRFSASLISDCPNIDIRNGIFNGTFSEGGRMDNAPFFVSVGSSQPYVLYYVIDEGRRLTSVGTGSIDLPYTVKTVKELGMLVHDGVGVGKAEEVEKEVEGAGPLVRRHSSPDDRRRLLPPRTAPALNKFATAEECSTGIWFLRGLTADNQYDYPTYGVYDCAKHPADITSTLWLYIECSDCDVFYVTDPIAIFCVIDTPSPTVVSSILEPSFSPVSLTPSTSPPASGSVPTIEPIDRGGGGGEETPGPTMPMNNTNIDSADDDEGQESSVSRSSSQTITTGIIAIAAGSGLLVICSMIMCYQGKKMMNISKAATSLSGVSNFNQSVVSSNRSAAGCNLADEDSTRPDRQLPYNEGQQTYANAAGRSLRDQAYIVSLPSGEQAYIIGEGVQDEAFLSTQRSVNPGYRMSQPSGDQAIDESHPMGTQGVNVSSQSYVHEDQDGHHYDSGKVLESVDYFSDEGPERQAYMSGLSPSAVERVVYTPSKHQRGEGTERQAYVSGLSPSAVERVVYAPSKHQRSPHVNRSHTFDGHPVTYAGSSGHLREGYRSYSPDEYGTNTVMYHQPHQAYHTHPSNTPRRSALAQNVYRRSSDDQPTQVVQVYRSHSVDEQPVTMYSSRQSERLYRSRSADEHPIMYGSSQQSPQIYHQRQSIRDSPTSYPSRWHEWYGSSNVTEGDRRAGYVSSGLEHNKGEVVSNFDGKGQPTPLRMGEGPGERGVIRVGRSASKGLRGLGNLRRATIPATLQDAKVDF